MLGPEIEFSVPGAVLIGLGVGFLVGLLGVGGGFILVPLLNVILGIPLRIVGPSSLCQIGGASLAGLLRHRRQGQFDGPVAAIMLGGVFVGVGVGVRIINWLKARGSLNLAGGSYAAADVVLGFVFLGMLAAIGGLMLAGAIRAGRRASGLRAPNPELGRAGLLSKVKLPPYITPVGGRPVSVILVAYSGVLVGVPQAMLGIGGGVLLLPILIYLVGTSTHAAVGTSLLVILVSSVWGTLLHALSFNISLPLVAALLVGSTFGSQLGALASTRFPGRSLRKCFALAVAVAALLLAWKLAAIFGLLPPLGGGRAGKPAAGAPEAVSLLTYNVLADDSRAAGRAPALLGLLETSGADVIALQEVAPWFVQHLRRERWTAAYNSTLEGISASPPGGLLILSRLPIEARVYRPLESGQGRGVLLARLAAGKRRLAVATVHLESPLKAGAVRARQLEAAFRLLDESGADDAVLLGDLNFGDGEQPETDRLRKEYLDLWKVLRRAEAGFTWNVEKSEMARAGSFPGEGSRRLDRILVRSERWRVKSVRIIGDRPVSPEGPDLFPSDHFGLLGGLERR